MDHKRLLELAGVKEKRNPVVTSETGDVLHEVRVGSSTEEDIKYNGYKLEQEKEFEDTKNTIWHSVSKGGKHIATLDHNPREWIDEKTFKKYIDFYEKRGRFPNRDDFGPGAGTNEKIKQLKESTNNSEHYHEEKKLFDDAISILQQVKQFSDDHKDGEESPVEYTQISKESKSLIETLQHHLKSYQ